MQVLNLNKSIILVFMLVTNIFVPVLGEDDSIIYWKDHPVLSWDDFQGNPPDDPGPEAAYTYSYLSGFSCTTGIVKVKQTDNHWKAEIKVTSVTGGDACFDKSKSWVAPDQKTDKLLKHEQGHFDMYEAASRSFKKSLLGLTAEATGVSKEEALNKALEKIKAKADQIHDAHLSWINEMNKDYDEETRHGTDETKQNEWSGKIAKWLGAPSFVIPESPMGTISLLFVMVVTLILFTFMNKRKIIHSAVT